ncbi:hypothetical protein K402DRAFT_372206 [Aulographum hederae CBS 113979]|uniref:Uncharacterized protein n=1 Tax=Aulographum hederae CBS 113979 TaxID=1176131 RepID=A0A6G1H8V1_9PEZI|nr:hypothetical protein K402DRAFT_372206 [Aulographum hederae CBS 113979]
MFDTYLLAVSGLQQNSLLLAIVPLFSLAHENGSRRCCSYQCWPERVANVGSLSLHVWPKPRGNIDTKCSRRIRKVAKDQQDFHQWLKAKENRLDKVELRTLECNNYEKCAEYWKWFQEQAMLKHDNRHQKGWRRWAKSTQSFGSKAETFVEAIKPIIQLAQGSGSPDGGLALSTICMLFAVASSKRATEDIIGEAMFEIQDHLPSFHTYEGLYRGADERAMALRGKITLAYCGFIELAIKSTRYYLKSGAYRFFKAPWNQREFQDEADEVKRDIVSVRNKCEELLAWTVSKIRDQNCGLQLEIEANRIREIESVLGHSRRSIDSFIMELKSYEASIEAENKQAIFESMNEEMRSKYKKMATFQDWSQSVNSSVLIIVGENHENLQLNKHCWMSPLALDLIKSLHSDSRMLGFFLFPFTAVSPAADALSDILFQLLDAKRQKLRDDVKFPNVVADIRRHHGIDTQKDDDGRFAVLAELLRYAMRLFDEEDCVHIVLDRMDRCVCHEQRELLDLLIDIMDKSVCKVKLLIVAEKTWGWDVKIKQLKKAENIQLTQTLESQKVLSS